MSSLFNRRKFLTVAAVALLTLQADTVPLRPVVEIAQASRFSGTRLWVREGIVAASNMEALSFVRRRGGQETNYAEEWRADLGDATVRTLLSQGVSLVIMTFHKGVGLKSEAQDIAAAREFVRVAPC